MSKEHSIIRHMDKLPQIFWVRLSLAFYFLVIMLLQLFSFDKFPRVLANVGVDQSISTVVSITLVLVGLLALPHLLGMKTSSKLLKVSSWLSPVFLFMLTTLEVIAFYSGRTILFGATFDLPGGGWSLLFLAAIWILWIWSVVSVLNAGVEKKTGKVKREEG